MGTFIIVFGGLVLFKLGFDRLFRNPKTKKKKSKEIKPKQKRNDPEKERAVAIENLMKNLSHAKTNRPEIIEQDPELAAKILKLWVKK
ncbi:MAG: hypothetical protein COA79_25105 [Planctomycetota bacterium]|nr:MAG: hypothetical protein COA79_25105 [Planctomycetota bacterium]